MGQDKQYRRVAVGGTWDLLHAGHKKLLEKAFGIGKEVVAGVTSDEYVKKFKVKSFEERKRELEEYLRERGWEDRVEVVKLEDKFGPLKDKFQIPIGGVVVSPETEKSAGEINEWRRKRGLEELDIVRIDYVLAEDGKPISSRRIRNGGINRQGVVWSKHRLSGRLPERMRAELRKPLGEVIQEINYQSLAIDHPVISVGDVSTKRLIEEGIRPELAVFDFKVQRERRFEDAEELGVGGEYEITKLENPAGMVAKELFDFFVEFGRHEMRIGLEIEGEEDLAVLPAVLSAPLGSVVVYGQPGGGLVLVEVTEEKKEYVFDILKRFESL